MIEKKIEKQKEYTLFFTRIGNEQLFITVLMNDVRDDQDTYETIYRHITDIIQASGMSVVLERIFGSLDSEKLLRTARISGIEKSGGVPFEPVTYIQGKSLYETGLAGIQMRAVHPLHPENIWPIRYKNEICGRGWRRNGTTYLLLQNIHGFRGDDSESRKSQTAYMFDRAREILKSQGGTYRDVVRTWIYLSDILNWYPQFNEVRNHKYSEFGLIHNPDTDKAQAERIYLPSSTGIQGDTSSGSCGTMDVFAIVRQPHSGAVIKPIIGRKQNSAFRYGSAFSRAMSIREKDATQILISGTASIDESGQTVYKGDVRSQILKTLEVIEALISPERVTLQDICKATVFLKHKKDLDIYLKVMDENGLSDLPAVVVQADVCREDLLFELDGVASVY
jgi:enamine deaminase RidA (YjgF/YER057c/UK114 family)